LVRKEVCFALFLPERSSAAAFAAFAAVCVYFSLANRADTTPAISSKEPPKCLCNAPNNLLAHLRQQGEKIYSPSPARALFGAFFALSAPERDCSHNEIMIYPDFPSSAIIYFDGGGGRKALLLRGDHNCEGIFHFLILYTRIRLCFLANLVTHLRASFPFSVPLFKK